MAHIKVLSILVHLHLLLAVALDLASSIPTMNSDKVLQSQFGNPPHHGRELLRWYIKNCLDKNNKALCNHRQNVCSIHTYKNNEKLPNPPAGFIFLTIGNLNKYGGEDLPDQVRVKKNNNADRLVVEYNKTLKTISKIYISVHYNNTTVYKIGENLRKSIKKDKRIPVVTNCKPMM